MAAEFHCIFILFLALFLTYSADEATVPKFAFSWLDDKDTFRAGDTATIKIKVLGNFDSKGNASLDRSAFKPALTVNGKTGNSSYVSGVLLDTAGDPSTWQIVFTPILAGLFNLIIDDDPFKVMDSSLHFTVEPGSMYPSASVASWLGFLNEFEAGSKAPLLILPKDAFGNNVSSTDKELNSYNISMTALHENGSIATMVNITNMGWNEFGYIIVEFMAVKAGNFLLHMEGASQILNGSPLPFKVNPGPLDVSNCVAKWKFEFNAWQIFSKMEILIYQQDQYGNLVPGLTEFDADVIEKETNLSVPVGDLQFEEVEPGIQLFSFGMSEPGNFLLTISDMKHNKSISNMPYAYTVFVGYCDGFKSFVNGTGLNSSVAGEMAEFSVYLSDAFQYPSPVEVERLQVEIKREIDACSVLPTIYPTQFSNGELLEDAVTETEFAPAPSVGLNNTPPESLKVQASAFNVMYTPEKSGIYKIHILCGNIILNGGIPFTKEVKAGEVNISLSGVLRFSPKAPKLVRNEIVVQLRDSFANPVLSEQSKLSLELVSVNKTGFSSWMFVDNNDGSYTGHYLAMEVGTYEMCVSFDREHFSPCPFEINVYGSEYFPKAYDDTISLWEDESISFDVLGNDYFAGGNASIVKFSKPGHGSLLQYGRLFRYTPYKDYYGNDSFLYTISDINGELATAAVNISVLTIPPQLISFPSQLQAMEDVISPRFGGYYGFEMKYSDPMENISVILSAKSGKVFLSPMPMQFWQPIWSELSVSKGDEEGKNLTIKGRLEAINFALQSIQYLGNENFSGADTLRVSARNRNGVNDLDVPVLVEPINDPPYVNVPEFIILKSTRDESLLFNKETDKFQFSIGDPDLLNFPGGESGFLLTFSVEVSDGFLLATLPAALIDSTELKLKSTYQWQPLQTYVTISKHFKVKAIGIRFRASLNDCNTVMEQLAYHGGEHGAAITVKISDLGHYGCYLDCAERVSKPLCAEATVNLIRGRPMSSLLVRTLGSAIFIEFLSLLSLGSVFLFFTCKCAILLVNEKRRQNPRNSEPSRVQSSQQETLSANSTEDAIHFTGCCCSSALPTKLPLST
ncbi:PREDICTED: protein GAMETE EXPRESSED 2 [Theobroma cacao]|uniref:Protein GAMETE EXPRESSED 2 n=1 Tax=Theobroma cacao TaxID=3641 RepID=A0AB32WBP9_THECC|nr:PREDICTED: protein GAMETE EXPRESSED 2 [Theobroma cacao]